MNKDDIDYKRELYNMGVSLATRKNPFIFNNSEKSLHITYAEWDDLLSIYRITLKDNNPKLVFNIHMGNISTYEEDYCTWQKILEKEYRKKFKKLKKY